MGTQTTIPGSGIPEKKTRTFTPLDKEMSLVKRMVVQLQAQSPGARTRIMAYLAAWVADNTQTPAAKEEEGDALGEF